MLEERERERGGRTAAPTASQHPRRYRRQSRVSRRRIESAENRMTFIMFGHNRSGISLVPGQQISLSSSDTRCVVPRCIDHGDYGGLKPS